jgi:hypothetical protein
LYVCNMLISCAFSHCFGHAVAYLMLYVIEGARLAVTSPCTT